MGGARPVQQDESQHSTGLHRAEPLRSPAPRWLPRCWRPASPQHGSWHPCWPTGAGCAGDSRRGWPQHRANTAAHPSQKLRGRQPQRRPSPHTCSARGEASTAARHCIKKSTQPNCAAHLHAFAVGAAAFVDVPPRCVCKQGRGAHMRGHSCCVVQHGRCSAPMLQLQCAHPCQVDPTPAPHNCTPSPPRLHPH